MLSLEQLTTGYTHRIGFRKAAKVISGPLDLTLAAGEMVCLLGPNGSGKSTLLRTIAGLQSPLSGGVRVRDKQVHHLPAIEVAKRLSVVLTGRAEVGHLTGRELVAMGRYPYTSWAGSLSESDQRMVDQAIVQMNAGTLADRWLHQLSDGEHQKLMLARALAQDTPVLLLDEPTAHLDLPNRTETMWWLKNIAHQMGKCVLVSTHELDLALRMANRLLLLDGSGMIEGLPETLMQNGTIQRVFGREGLVFDPHSLQFQIVRGDKMRMI